jgi:hypothetical protein
MQEKPVYVVLESAPEAQVKESKRSTILKFVLFACVATVVVAVVLFVPTSRGYSSNNSSSKAGAITDNWENCTAASACGPGFTCCTAFADLASGKQTCRQQDLPANDPNGCGVAVNSVVPEWNTCFSGSTCANGFTCCVAPADFASGKRTCRQPGLPVNAPNGCGVAASTLVPEWETCYAGSVCANGFTCCVAPADVAEGKRTCRQPGLSANAKDGCASSSVPAITPAWQNCTSVSVCESGFTCCVAPADTASGKKTCRQTGLAPNAANGCAAVVSVAITSTSASAPAASSAAKSSSAAASALASTASAPASASASPRASTAV